MNRVLAALWAFLAVGNLLGVFVGPMDWTTAFNAAMFFVSVMYCVKRFTKAIEETRSRKNLVRR